MYRYSDFDSLVSSEAFRNGGFAFKNLSATEIVVAVGVGRRIPAHFHLPRQGGESWEIVEGSCIALRAQVENRMIGDMEAEMLLANNPAATNVFDGRYLADSIHFEQLGTGDHFVIPETWLHGCENEGTSPTLIYAVATKPDDRKFRLLASPYKSRETLTTQSGLSFR